MNKILGVDIDEVLSESIEGALKFHNYTLNGMPITKDDISDYYIFNISKYNITQEQGVEFFRKYLDESQEREDTQTVAGAREGLEKLKAEGWKIVLITARKESIKDYTMRRLEKNFHGLYDDIYFSNHFSEKQVNKSQLCLDHGIKCMIEDNINYAIEMAANGIHVYLIDKPWNRQYDPSIHKSITKFYKRSELQIGE